LQTFASSQGLFNGNWHDEEPLQISREIS